MADQFFDAELRKQFRNFRNTARYTPVEIIHHVRPTSGAAATETFSPELSGNETSYLRTGALGEQPGRSYDILTPGGYPIGGRVRITFDGLGTGNDAIPTLRLFTGAESMHGENRGVSVEMMVHGVRFSPDGQTIVDATDEIIIDALAKEVM